MSDACHPVDIKNLKHLEILDSNVNCLFSQDHGAHNHRVWNGSTTCRQIVVFCFTCIPQAEPQNSESCIAHGTARWTVCPGLVTCPSLLELLPFWALTENQHFHLNGCSFIQNVCVWVCVTLARSPVLSTRISGRRPGKWRLRGQARSWLAISLDAPLRVWQTSQSGSRP